MRQVQRSFKNDPSANFKKYLELKRRIGYLKLNKNGVENIYLKIHRHETDAEE